MTGNSREPEKVTLEFVTIHCFRREREKKIERKKNGPSTQPLPRLSTNQSPCWSKWAPFCLVPSSLSRLPSRPPYGPGSTMARPQRATFVVSITFWRLRMARLARGAPREPEVKV